MDINKTFSDVRDLLMANTKGMSDADFLEVLDSLQEEIDTHRESIGGD